MNNTKNILITGGTGLVGKRLQELLKLKGYSIKLLSSQKPLCNGTDIFHWDYATQYIDEKALENVDYIIHLAGANIAEKKWTSERMRLIIDSRSKTAELLFNALKNNTHSVKAFISSSATGYYGAVTSQTIFRETDAAATDFLGMTCQQWENSVQPINALGIRTVLLRTGVVLANHGGAIAKLKTPAKFGLSAALGSGKQYFPWIHIDDLCNMYLKAIEDENLYGPYNAVSPQHVTNKEFTQALATTLHKPYFLPNVPAFILKLALGEMALILLEGSRVSSDNIQRAGFEFQYRTINEALQNILFE